MSDLNKVIVVPVSLEKHPDADSLSIVRIDEYVVIVRTQDWAHEDRGAYIPPDNMVDITRPEFTFLDNGIVDRQYERIKAKRFRGIMSQGLLVPIPTISYVDVPAEYKFNIGDDVTEYFGVKRYVSPADLALGQGEQSAGPQRPGINYDIESWFKYKKHIPDDAVLVMTEKIHGANARFTFQDGKMHVGSHTYYRKEGFNLFWRALKENPWIQQFCEKFPDTILYGEIFGYVQDLKYGADKGQIFFKAFDVLYNGKFWNWDEFYNIITESGTKTERVVPVLGEILGKDLNSETIQKFMNGPSTIYSKHMREGVVIKSIREIQNLYLGRVILKAVSPEYLAKAA